MDILHLFLYEYFSLFFEENRKFQPKGVEIRQKYIYSEL